MSFDVEAAGGYGSGSLGDITNPSGQINSYALIDSFGTHKGSDNIELTSVQFTNDTKYYSNGIYHDLTDLDSIKGVEVMIVNVAQASSGNQNRLGEYRICKVTTKIAVREDGGTASAHILFLDQNINSIFSNNGCYKMLITIPHFRNLTLNSSWSISPPTVNVNSDGTIGVGGYVVLKCSNTLTLESNCSIELRNCGFARDVPDSFRPLTTQESNGTLDTNLYAGAENSITKDHLILNRGDGACWVLARNISTAGTARIGSGRMSGVQYCRGAEDSPNLPANASNVGGSTICVVCQNWTGFSPAIIAKYRYTALDATYPRRGLARAYIAVNSQNSTMRPDEGLYTIDTVKNLTRLKSSCNIGGFGDGHNDPGAGGSSGICFNSYGRVTLVSDDGYTLSYLRLDHDYADQEVFDFDEGNLVMVHMTQKSAGNHLENGRFFLARIVNKVMGTARVTLNHACPFNPDDCYIQMVVVPQYGSLNYSGTYVRTPAFSRAGGIFAVACNGTLNLSNAVIDLTGKGTFLKNTNCLMGNMEMRNRLPIGQGNGSAFILAKNLIMSSATRIGGTFSGAEYGGKAVSKVTATSASNPTFTAQGGYAGVNGTCRNDTYPTYVGTAGWGGGAGKNEDAGNHGGWFSNAANTDDEAYDGAGFQGAHVMIIADTITNFYLSAISTGGVGGRGYDNAALARYNGGDGGAGYGGGGFPCVTSTTVWRYGGSGGYRGGGGGTTAVGDSYFLGGGGAGAAFIYCNNVVNQNTTGILTA